MSENHFVFKNEYVIAFLLFIVATLIWIWGFNTNYFGNRDAHDYAQMGRELSNGNGFSTLQIFPRHIPFLQKKNYLDKKSWPNLHRFPLPSILNAFFYKMTKDIIKAAVMQSGVAFLLSVPVLFLLATRLTNITIISYLFYSSGLFNSFYREIVGAQVPDYWNNMWPGIFSQDSACFVMSPWNIIYMD